MSDTESLDYLQEGFNPATLTIPRLRSILVSYNIPYPASAKKSQLIEIFQENILPRSRKILAERARARRTSRGIVNAEPSDASTTSASTASTSFSRDEELMPPPPTPRARSTRNSRVRSEESESDLPTTRSTRSRSPVKRTPRPSIKHARIVSESDNLEELETARKSARRTRKSNVMMPAGTIKYEEDEDALSNVSNVPKHRESAFSDKNPFQSGSSPMTELARTLSHDRRRTTGGRVPSASTKKKSAPRRHTDYVTSGDDDIHPPTSATFEMPVSKLNGSSVSKAVEPEDDGLQPTEEFTADEQMELVRERSAKGESAVVPRRQPKKTGGFSLTTPLWVMVLTMLGGYAYWYRQEKIDVGYCGVGRPQNKVVAQNEYIPDWAKLLAEPECEICPQHATCSDKMQIFCEQDFILKHHPLSLNGWIPLPPACEPDGEKVRRVKAVADRAVEELRERRAKYECGDLTTAEGVPEPTQPTAEIQMDELKKEVAKKRSKRMSEAEFEELWQGAIGEIKGREEVEARFEENDVEYLTSTSLSRLPLTCSIKRSARLSVARHRLQITLLGLLAFLAFYARAQYSAHVTTRSLVPTLVNTALDRLAMQAARAQADDREEAWISIGQLRDDVLRDEHSIKKREKLWQKVRKVVEMNANVRAAQRESRSGDVSRVWEWIGNVPALPENELGSSFSRRKSGRVSFEGEDGGSEVVQQRWQEPRPIY